ncbi:hypothetical protein OS493_037893 [Desmophyllum pertusum]|uniref:Uncharacterized protein n=1 Tax=Desmophyllum pertusum TaxID=174260 RepID=A0A9X0D698_9CNID|nr:hypothetical protein OS493_037893 [Desmophyllum pertusum]
MLRPYPGKRNDEPGLSLSTQWLMIEQQIKSGSLFRKTPLHSVDELFVTPTSMLRPYPGKRNDEPGLSLSTQWLMIEQQIKSGRTMPKQKSVVASAFDVAAVGMSKIVSPVGWAASVGARAITGIFTIAIAKIQQDGETEREKEKEVTKREKEKEHTKREKEKEQTKREKEKEQTKREKEKEQTKREKEKEHRNTNIWCFAIFALCFFICYVSKLIYSKRG